MNVDATLHFVQTCLTGYIIELYDEKDNKSMVIEGKLLGIESFIVEMPTNEWHSKYELRYTEHIRFDQQFQPSIVREYFKKALDVVRNAAPEDKPDLYCFVQKMYRGKEMGAVVTHLQNNFWKREVLSKAKHYRYREMQLFFAPKTYCGNMEWDWVPWIVSSNPNAISKEWTRYRQIDSHVHFKLMVCEESEINKEVLDWMRWEESFTLTRRNRRR